MAIQIFKTEVGCINRLSDSVSVYHTFTVYTVDGGKLSVLQLGKSILDASHDSYDSLMRNVSTTYPPPILTKCIFYMLLFNILTRMINLIATTPEVAIILALFGIKLKIVGIMASAPWSNLFPRTDDKCLQ